MKNKVKVLCHTCRGYGHIGEQKYVDKMYASVIEGSQGTMAYYVYVKDSEGVITKVPVVEVVCPECEGRKFVIMEKAE